MGLKHDTFCPHLPDKREDGAHFPSRLALRALARPRGFCVLSKHERGDGGTERQPALGGAGQAPEHGGQRRRDAAVFKDSSSETGSLSSTF